MMKRTFTATGFALTLSLPIPLLAADFATLDVNGDGYVTMAEFQEGLPETPADAFMSADANGDGALSEAEISAAQEAGTLPPSES